MTGPAALLTLARRRRRAATGRSATVGRQALTGHDGTFGSLRDSAQGVARAYRSSRFEPAQR
ncbi:MAG: hypothetical protein WBL40_06620, partial [Terrimicrobiaceae bacterium]